MGKDIQLWNLEIGKLLDILLNYIVNVCLVVMSLNGKILVSGSEDGIVKLWDIFIGEMLNSFWYFGLVIVVGFIVDGKGVIGCSFGNGMKLWDIYIGELLYRMNGS